MRLLHSQDFTFHEFEGDVPPYVILSHTWEDGEVLYKDMLKKRHDGMKGFKKIRYCAAEASKRGFNYVWVDTCNIEKKSSAELSEAINSMYKWYQRAAVCCVYLADVQKHEVHESLGHESQFSKSRWFERGWTLQELIAPRHVEFYTSNWQFIGTKNSMHEAVEDITRIPSSVLTEGKLQECDIATRMAWASTRRTTRPEDIAYSLLGIFDINMPLLYGEGDKAFLRLQEEIIKKSQDQSIFAWTSLPHELPMTFDETISQLGQARWPDADQGTDMFAASIKQFSWALMKPARSSFDSTGNVDFQLTNAGSRSHC